MLRVLCNVIVSLLGDEQHTINPYYLIPPSMLSDCRTKSSWLHGLWKKAASHCSFQILS